MSESAAASPPPPTVAQSPASEDRQIVRPSRVRGLSCPSCGGALEVQFGLRVVTCPYCDTPLLAVHEIDLRRYAVQPAIEPTRARQIASRWLAAGMHKEPRLRSEARLGEAFLTFLPFFRIQAECIGFALGTEQRRRTVGSGKHRRTETYEVDVERSVEKSFDRTYPALNVAEWGLQRVDLRGDAVVPFDAGVFESQGMVFPPTGSQVAVRQAARQKFELESDPAAGLHRVRFRFLRTLRERTSVIYYPLFVIRYRFRGRAYQVLVDGEDGSLAYGKAPGNDLYRAVMMVGSQAAALYLGTTLLQHWGGGAQGFLLIGLGILAALFWAWRKFRHGGVVVEGSGTRSEIGTGRSFHSLRGLLSGGRARRGTGPGGDDR